MSEERKVSCVMCGWSRETKATGPLSTKDKVTAHQNCLLFSSGICCQYVPEFDDLFGFSVKDVKKEVKRGRKLVCNKCKKKGATVGCEVKRCRRSYHYPCAVGDGAQPLEDADNGKYMLYCFQHQARAEENDDSTQEFDTFETRTSKKPSEAPGSKASSVPSEEAKGKSSLVSTPDSLINEEPEPPSHQMRADGDSTAAGQSDNNSLMCSSLKRQPIDVDKQDKTPLKLRPRNCRWISSGDSSSSDERERSDVSGPVTISPLKYVRIEGKNPFVSSSEYQTEESEDETNGQLEGESVSVLPCAVTSMADDSGQRVSSPECLVTLTNAEEIDGDFHPGSGVTHSTPGRPLSPALSEPCLVNRSSPVPSPALSPDRPLSPLPCTSTATLPLRHGRTMRSTIFWKKCNAAGCTKSIFCDFIKEMEDISERIQSEQASQEDYNCALQVMVASGKLEELVAKQQRGLEEKQMELQKASAAMEEVVAVVLRR